MFEPFLNKAFRSFRVADGLRWLKRVWGYPDGGGLALLTDGFVFFLGITQCFYVLLVVLGGSLGTFWWVAATFFLMTVAWGLYGLRLRSFDLRLTGESLAIVGTAIMAVMASLVIDRPDGDDDAYLVLLGSALDAQALPLEGLQFLGPYLWDVERYLVAGFSTLTGVPLLAVYYLVAPALLALFTVLFAARLIRALQIRYVTAALFFLLVIMLFWGDSHRSLSNVGIARFFHGKSAVAWIAMPAMWGYWLSLRRRFQGRTLLLLLLCVPLGFSLSPSGLYVTMLGLAMLLLARLAGVALRPGSRGMVRVGILMGALLVVVFAAYRLGYLLIADGVFGWQGDPQLISFEGMPLNRDLLPHVLGTTFRGWVVYPVLLFFPILLGWKPSTRGFLGYAIVSVLLVLNPLTPAWVATAIHNTGGWRWYWVLPIVPALLVFFDGLILLGKRYRYGWALPVFFIGTYLLSDGIWVFSTANHARLGWPRYHLPQPESSKTQDFGRGAPVIEIRAGRLVSPKGNLY